MATKKTQDKVEAPILVTAPNFQTICVRIVGTAPLVVERFSKKAELMQKMSEGAAAKNKKVRAARDYEKEMEESKYIEKTGAWEGMNIAAFRNACISACRVTGLKMTMTKMCLFFQQDGVDYEGIPLARIYGKARLFSMYTRNATGVVDIRVRPQYEEWGTILTIVYDADQFDRTSIMNLIHRAGIQVGVGAGRPDSKKSTGCGWGTFRIANPDEDLSYLGMPAAV